MLRMKTSLILFLTLVTTLAFSQRPGGGGAQKDAATGEIFGNVTDSISEQPVSYVRILAFKQPENEMITGGVTQENGDFSIAPLPLGTYNLKIDFVGYESKLIEGIKLTADSKTYQLKELTLAPTVLNTVEVISGVPDITYEIDKKVINVEDQMNTDGQTAVEVLQNMPSITVSADGTVSLRGSSSFTLLIDGVPTVLDASDALSTIPASSIKDIEIITNPSAKYDAEGTSGVINIITKKNKLQGISCLINLNAGRFENYGGDVAVNIKKEKFTFDISANYNQRGRPSDTRVERTTQLNDSTVNRLISEGEDNWARGTVGMGAGLQWNPNNSHVMVLRTDFRSTLMEPYSDYYYEEYQNDSLISNFFTDQHNYIEILNNTTSLYYQYNIKRDKEHNISFKAIASLKQVNQSDTTLSYNEDGIRQGNLYTEVGPSNFYRFNVDYKLPLKGSKKFEAGLQSQLGESGDIGKNYTYNTTTDEFDFNPLFSSDVNYVRDVHAAYSIFGGKFKKLGYQAGLRAEYTFRRISSTTATNFAEINRLDWFPSAHMSYQFKNKIQVLLSYSRRIERPRSYFFEPFITWESPFSVRTGNPNLEPEYINAFEASAIKQLKQKGFLSVEAFYRQSNNIINRISTVYEPGILISQPYNIGTSKSYGVEATVNYNLFEWWKINTGINVYQFDLTGQIEDVDYSASSLNWSGRLSNGFNYKKWSLELMTRFQSGSVTAQGRELSSFSQDVSVRRSLLKKRLSLTLQGRNIFATARRGEVSVTENVTVDRISYQLAPQIMLSVSVKLNNYQKVAERNEDLDDF